MPRKDPELRRQRKENVKKKKDKDTDQESKTDATSTDGGTTGKIVLTFGQEQPWHRLRPT